MKWENFRANGSRCLCNDLTMAGLEVDEIVSLKNDHIIDIDLTPNRADCLSVMGIARELNCINKKYNLKKLKKEIDPKPTCENINLQLNIIDKEICPRFTFMTLRDLSEEWETSNIIFENNTHNVFEHNGLIFAAHQERNTEKV